jgi:fatty acid desaturase
VLAPVTDHTAPTARLTSRGTPLHADRAAWHRTPRRRNAVALASTLAQTYGVAIAAGAVHTWWAYLAAVVVLARGTSLFVLLAHEAMHSGLLGHRRIDHWIARWLLAEPLFTRFAPGRRAHMGHHRDSYGPADRTAGFSAQFPVTRRRFRRIVLEDLCFVTAWRENLRPIAWTAVHRPRLAIPTVTWHGAAVSLALLFGRPLAYVAWFVAWGTVGRLFNTLRSISEHGGLDARGDHRRNVHVVRQSWLPRLFLMPYNSGAHLAHHMDPAVPWTRLPAYERLLVDEGFLDESQRWPSHRAVWRWCASA